MNGKYNNNMLEAFETMGQWWLPGSEQQFSGILKYDPQESVLELEIVGNIIPLKSGPIIPQQIKLVNGLTVAGQYMSLYNCLYCISSIKAPGYTTCKIYPQFIFIGCCFDSEDEIKFNQAIYSCYNLEELMGVSGIKPELKFDDNKIASYKLSYEFPKKVNFKFDCFDVSTNISLQNFPVTGHKLTISETAAFKISTTKYLTHTDFLSGPITSIHNFLELIYNEKLPFRSVVLRSDKLGHEQDGKFYQEPILLLWKQGVSYPLPTKKHPLELIFTVYELANELDGIMRKWHKNRFKYEPAHNLFFTTFHMKRELTIQNVFLGLCQVLETFHRIKNNEMVMPEEEFDSLIKCVLEATPEQHRKFLGQRLQYGNELGLRQRLKQLYNCLPPGFQNKIGKKKGFVQKMVVTRNYLTHYDEKIKNEALSISEMMQWEPMLINFCKALFLQEAGVSNEIIDSKLANFKTPDIFSFD